MKCDLKIQLEQYGAKMPERREGDAGFDIFSPGTVDIYPHDDIMIASGWRCEFNKEYAMIVHNKGGRAVKDNLFVGACVVDSNFRGVVQVHLFNHSDQTVRIEKGEKIAQFIMHYLPDVSLTGGKVNMDTDRGEGMLGSTGLK